MHSDPVAKKHLQAHMQARMGITQFLIKEGIAKLEEIRDSSGKLTDLCIRVRISSAGFLLSAAETMLHR